MIKICKQNQESVLKKIYKNDFDIVTASTSNLVDDIILAMYEQGILECLLKIKELIIQQFHLIWY